MKLTGEVILDENSLEKLKEEVRKDVIEEIRNKGLHHIEITKYLSSIDNVTRFANILKEVMPEFLHNMEDKDFHFDDEKIYAKLMMCYKILMM